MTNLNEMKVYNPTMDAMELLTPAWVESINGWMHLFATRIKLIRYILNIEETKISKFGNIENIADMSMIEFRQYYNTNKVSIDKVCYGETIPESLT